MEDIGGQGLGGQFTVLQDEEQMAKMAETLELLVSAGYFRAKIDGLSSFDKLCAEIVDVDLLYSENSSIGQKIALTENIVKVLPRFKCPHSIEPHQIQGLDCIHILPVMKWLVKEAIEAKLRHGDENLQFATEQFRKSGWTMEEQSATSSTQITDKPKPKPVRRRERGDQLHVDSLDDDLKCTLLEYGLDVSEVVVKENLHDEEPGREKRREIEANFLRDLQVTEQLLSELTDVDPAERKRVSARAVNQMLDSADLEDAARSSQGLREVFTEEQQLERSRQSLKAMELNMQQDALEEKRLEEENQRLEEEVEKMEAKIRDFDEVVAATNPETVAEAERLLDACQQVRADENEYKRECRRKMRELDEQVEAVRASDASQTVDDADMRRLQEQKHTLEQQLVALNRDLVATSKRADRAPSQLELNQYQRRFVELYNLVTAKHLEARRVCMSHNALVDECNFIRNEIALLNSLDEQKESLAKEQYKASFLDNMRRIAKVVEGNLDKVTARRTQALQRKDRLADELFQLQEQKRLYHKAVADLQRECQRNEELRAAAQKRQDEVDQASQV